MKIYGIKNCGSVKKAFDFFARHDISYEFHDYKKSGIDEVSLRDFIGRFGLDKVVNRKGMTYRGLSDAQKEACQDIDGAVSVMIEKNSVIKRPIILGNGVELIGFDEDGYEGALL